MERYFADCNVSGDMKVLFIEQHSMKLGDSIFYDLESKRQKYLGGMESLPYLGSVFGLMFFIGFAYVTPLSSKLYKESAMSLVLGMGLAAQYPFYYRREYLKQVGLIYDRLNVVFEKHPHLKKPDSEDAVKNFGFTRWNDEMFEGEEDMELDDSLNPFEGTAEDEKEMTKQEFMDGL